MAVAYITEQHAWVRKTSDRLIVEKDHVVLAEIPCLKLDAVMIFGNVQVTTQALVEMLDHGIELALFSRNGRLRGQLTGPKTKNIVLRMKQYESLQNEALRLAVAREMVRAKVANSLAVVERFRANHPDAFPATELEGLRAADEGAHTAGNLASLRGVEGSAAAGYFCLLGRMLPESLGFEERNRRPPKDPVNALLSLGYVVLGAELQALLDGMGFDPYLGLFHDLDYGRPSLALDLLEEFRPAIVDRFVLEQVNLRVLAAADFVSSPDDGVVLGLEGKRTFFRRWEEWLTTAITLESESLTPRQLVRRQAERLARTLVDGEPYEGFRLPC